MSRWLLTSGAFAAIALAGLVPAQAAFMPTVLVGDPGNAPSTGNTSWGGVSYLYRIGQFEVTNAQYTDFLNAVARVSDPYYLYSSLMAGTLYGLSGEGFATTTGGGEFLCRFEVTMQPGDNFRISGTTIPDWHANFMTQQRADTIMPLGGCVPCSLSPCTPENTSCAGMASPMLTVWRRLHVELDSMDAVFTPDNTVLDHVVAAVSGPGYGSGFLHVDITLANPLPPEFDEINHFETPSYAQIDGIGLYGAFESGEI